VARNSDAVGDHGWVLFDFDVFADNCICGACRRTQRSRRACSQGKSLRVNGLVSLYLLAVSILFLGAISLPFDFHECVYPSRQNPYFLSGRIICGTLLPFAVIYAGGFEFLWRPLRRYVHPIIPFAVICVLITGSEMLLRADVFHSAFNFFSLSGR